MDVIKTQPGRWLQIPGFHLEWRASRVVCRRYAQTQEPIHNLLEWLPGLPHFFAQDDVDIIVNGKSVSHIMMLSLKTS